MLMSSLLKLAIEGVAVESAPETLDTGGTHTGGEGPEAAEGSSEKDLIILKGPLAEQFSLALSKLYSKTPEVKTEDAQTEAMEGVAVATESQANDALTLQEFADTTQVLGEDDAPDNATTVYGVDAADVKPEDVVEVSQDLADWNAEDEDFVVVMNAENGGENAEPQVNQYANALEAMCLRAGVPVYPSLESYAEKRKEHKEKIKELHFKSGKGKLTEGHEASDVGLGLDFCDPEVLGVVMKLTQEKIDPNLGEDSDFFPAGGKIDAVREAKVKDFVKEVELHFKGKIDPKAGVSIKTPKQVAKYFSKGKINGKAIKAIV